MLNVRLASDHLYVKLLSTWLSLVMSLMVSFVLSLFQRDVLDEIFDLIESVFLCRRSRATLIEFYQNFRYLIL